MIFFDRFSSSTTFLSWQPEHMWVLHAVSLRLKLATLPFQPFKGVPRTYGQLCQHYMENELMENQGEATIEKAFATIETYKRHLIKRIIPRWGRLAPLALESLAIETWFKELKKGNPKENVKPLADPTIDKIRRVMNLVYLHGQRCNFLPRQQEGNGRRDGGGPRAELLGFQRRENAVLVGGDQWPPGASADPACDPPDKQPQSHGQAREPNPAQVFGMGYLRCYDWGCGRDDHYVLRQ
jgi:hypothetical protein